MRKIEREYAALCHAGGFALERIERRGVHLALHFPAGFVIAAGSPSDRRNGLNVRAAIRRLHVRDGGII